MIGKVDETKVHRPTSPIDEQRFMQDVCLVSCSQPSPGITPMDFLRQSKGKERFYWEDGRHSVAFAGFGVTANLMGWGKDRFTSIQRQARDLFRDAVLFIPDQPLAGPRLFGGFAFRDDFAPDNTWSVFNPAHFVLPHYQITQIDGESWMTINALIQLDEDPLGSVAQLREALAARYEILRENNKNLPSDSNFPKAVAVNYPMPYTIWEQKIIHATQHMKTAELNKVVLSRVCEIRLEERVDVDSALDYLNQHYANCYRFLFEPRPFHSFYGATPELLAEVTRSSLVTMSLASSIRRGQTPAEDDALIQELLNDPKERYEHALVVDSLRRRLAEISSHVEIPEEPTILRLSNIQHLYTPIFAQLPNPDGVLPVIEALHPTPALGGSPRHLAMDFISEAEPVPRGWYAAPIGCIDHNLDGIFGVAIRSAVSQEKRVWLYAGAGIVTDSIPQKEWDETALKFKPMLNALRLEIN